MSFYRHLYGWNDSVTFTSQEAVKRYSGDGLRPNYSIANYIKIGTEASEDGDVSEYADIDISTDKNGIQTITVTSKHTGGTIHVWGYYPTLNLWEKIGALYMHHVTGFKMLKYEKGTPVSYDNAVDITSKFEIGEYEYNDYSNYSYAHSKSKVNIGKNQQYRFYLIPEFTPSNVESSNVNLVYNVPSTYHLNILCANTDVDGDSINDAVVDLSVKRIDDYSTDSFEVNAYFNCDKNSFSGRTKGDYVRTTFNVSVSENDQTNEWEDIVIPDDPSVDYIEVSNTTVETFNKRVVTVKLKSNNIPSISYNRTKLTARLTSAGENEYRLSMTPSEYGDFNITATSGTAQSIITLKSYVSKISKFDISSPALTQREGITSSGYVLINQPILTEDGFIFADDISPDDYDFTLSCDSLTLTDVRVAIEQDELDEYIMKIYFTSQIPAGEYDFVVTERNSGVYASAKLFCFDGDYLVTPSDVVLKVGETAVVNVFTSSVVELEDIGEDLRDHANVVITKKKNDSYPDYNYYEIKITATSSTDGETIAFLYDNATIRITSDVCTSLSIDMGCPEKIYMDNEYDETKIYCATVTCDNDGEEFTNNFNITKTGSNLAIVGTEMSLDKKRALVFYKLTDKGVATIKATDGEATDTGRVEVIADYVTNVKKVIYLYDGVKVKLEGDVIKSDIAVGSDITWSNLIKSGSPKIHIEDKDTLKINVGKSELKAYYRIVITTKSGNEIEIDGGEQSLGSAMISSNGTGFNVKTPDGTTVSADSYVSSSYLPSALKTYKTFDFIDTATGANSVIVDINLVDNNNDKSKINASDFDVTIPYKYQDGSVIGSKDADEVEVDSSIVTSVSLLLSTGVTLPTWIRVSDITAYSLPDGWTWDATPSNPENKIPQVFVLNAQMTANPSIKKPVYVFYIPALSKYNVVLTDGWEGDYAEDPILLVLDKEVNRFYLLGMPSSVKNGNKKYGEVVTVTSDTLTGSITLKLVRE